MGFHDLHIFPSQFHKSVMLCAIRLNLLEWSMITCLGRPITSLAFVYPKCRRFPSSLQRFRIAITGNICLYLPFSWISLAEAPIVSRASIYPRLFLKFPKNPSRDLKHTYLWKMYLAQTHIDHPTFQQE